MLVCNQMIIFSFPSHTQLIDLEDANQDAEGTAMYSASRCWIHRRLDSAQHAYYV